MEQPNIRCSRPASGWRLSLGLDRNEPLTRTNRMAIILGGRTTCALCGEVIGELDAIFATSHFIGDCSHPFWRYSDAAMHQRCFLVWTERAEFVRCFNDIHKRHPSLKGTYLQMSEAGEIQVLQNDQAV